MQVDFDYATKHALLTGDAIRRDEMPPGDYITVSDTPPDIPGEIITVWTPTQADLDATNWRLV